MSAATWFPIPQEWIADGDRRGWLLELQSLYELKVAIVLLKFRNRKTGIAWPSLAKIAALAGVERGHAARALKSLVAAGRLAVVERGGGRGKRTSYRFVNSASDATVATALNGAVDATVCRNTLPHTQQSMPETVPPTHAKQCLTRTETVPHVRHELEEELEEEQEEMNKTSAGLRRPPGAFA